MVRRHYVMTMMSRTGQEQQIRCPWRSHQHFCHPNLLLLLMSSRTRRGTIATAACFLFSRRQFMRMVLYQRSAERGYHQGKQVLHGLMQKSKKWSVVPLPPSSTCTRWHSWSSLWLLSWLPCSPVKLRFPLMPTRLLLSCCSGSSSSGSPWWRVD